MTSAPRVNQMRFFSSVALDRAPKLMLAASCSAAENHLNHRPIASVKIRLEVDYRTAARVAYRCCSGRLSRPAKSQRKRRSLSRLRERPIGIGTRPFYAWLIGLGGGEMGLVVRPERNLDSAGIPAEFCSQTLGCTPATAMKAEQTPWTAHTAWSAWSEVSAAVIGISATVVSSGMPTLR